MARPECPADRLSRQVAAGRAVAEVMVGRPKTLPADASVGDVRRLFENPHVQTALLVDGPAFVGAIDRDELPADAAPDAPALAVARREGPTIGPEAPMSEALRLLDEADARRLVVLDADGSTLRGLLCLDERRVGFCR